MSICEPAPVIPFRKMRVSFGLASSLAVAVGALVVNATPSPRDSRSVAEGCVNSPANRSCWGEFNLSTNYNDVAPDTGNIVEYWFELVNKTQAFDGVERVTLTVNGTFPGPTIEANWGDVVRVHLLNSLENNGTSLHFHGIRQNYTNGQDGVASVTQCPTAPGKFTTYEWRAVQYGTSWYHSHFALQAWDGVQGGIVIHGPASANYDKDVGTLLLNDWSHTPVSALAPASNRGVRMVMDNGLINGTNVFGNGGKRFNITFESGRSYRFRLVNGAIDTFWKFSIDNHTLKVIAADFVPVVPYDTKVLNIGIGQRYDMVVNASLTSGAFWLRAIPQNSCSENNSRDNIKGIVSYNAADISEPTTTVYPYTDSCTDESLTNLVPYVPLNVGSDMLLEKVEVSVSQANATSGALVKWYMAATSFKVEWANPSAAKVIQNESFDTESHVVELAQANQWVYFVIFGLFGPAHPMHLHGHDFWILASGTGNYTDNVILNLKNPPRRDVAMLPQNGYLVIAIYTDNPGIWLMHCHIGWHASQGLALQLVERRAEIPAQYNIDTLNSDCEAWTSYAQETALIQDDSGI